MKMKTFATRKACV